jgi:hypothetical protein
MACDTGGNADMYGLGIRIGFYLQWFGTILANWLAADEVPGLRLATAFFIGATFLALLIQTSQNNIRPIDAYITLLLTYGSYYYYVPMYLWRLVVRCNPILDPSRWPRVRSSKLYQVLRLTLLIAVTCFQMWFWTTGINSMPRDAACDEYGFFFAQVLLRAPAVVAVNIVFVVALLLCTSVSLLYELHWLPQPGWVDKIEHDFERRFDRNLRRHGPEY